jgi:hypothetical protein
MTLDHFVTIRPLHNTVDAQRSPQSSSNCSTEYSYSLEPVIVHQESVKVDIPPAIGDEGFTAVSPSISQDNGIDWEDDLDECVQGDCTDSELRSWDIL